MARDLSQEPLFDVNDIQGDILVGLIKKVERLLFFEITDAENFRLFLKDLQITSMSECLMQAEIIAAGKQAHNDELIPTPGLNVAFTAAGLRKLGATDPDTPTDPLFEAGMAASQTNLSDPPSRRWSILRPSNHLHGVFIVTGSTLAEVADTISLRLAPVGTNGWIIRHEELGKVRPSPVGGHEHFGFADGVSQPGVRGQIAPGVALTPNLGTDEDQGMPGQDLLWPGEFVFGLPGQDGDADDFTVEGPIVEPPIPFMNNGAFLVFRRLAQKVPEFHQAVKAAAATTGGSTDEASADLLGAQLVGRWKSGAPIINAPLADDLSMAEGSGVENDFEFGGDRTGLVCPWAAHIRKAYPRDDVRGNTNPNEANGEVDKAEAGTQTHRMLRRGIAFGPELTEGEALSGRSDRLYERGLLFKCYVTSLEDQFEFVQRAWINNPDFVQPGSGIDALVGHLDDGAQPFLGAAPRSMDAARKPQLSFDRFIEMQGGAYFFAPSISAMQNLQSVVVAASAELESAE